MANIKNTLNLNKTPNLVESNSLVFSKNIRLDVDGTIHRDYGITKLSQPNPNLDDDNSEKPGEIIGGEIIGGEIEKPIISKVRPNILDVNNILKRIYNEIKDITPIESENKVYTNLKESLKTKFNAIYKTYYKVVGIIPFNTEFYIFIADGRKIEDYDESEDNTEFNRTINNSIGFIKERDKRCYIIKYDERTDKFTPCNCKWNYNYGEISGHVITNLRGEKILIVCESGTNKLIPLKCINLVKSNYDDDEQIYTQTPNIPLTNLKHVGDFKYSIPNGVYQFFVRYRIRENFYTDWFPASKELFVGNSNIENTSFGTIKHINTHKISDTSFILETEHLIDVNKKQYDSIQIGFICSNDNQIVARAWKHFDFNTTIINFDYRTEDGVEIEILDLTKPTYQLYNVGNVANFKNKTYISNYTETEFNEDLQKYANNIKITLGEFTPGDSYGDLNIVEKTDDGGIISLKISEKERNIGGSEIKDDNNKSIIRELCEINQEDKPGIKNIIDSYIKNNNVIEPNGNPCYIERYNLNIYISGNYIYKTYQDKWCFDNRFKDILFENITIPSGIPYNPPVFQDTISNIEINSKVISNKTADSVLNHIYDLIHHINTEGKFCDKDNNIIDKIDINIYRKVNYYRLFQYRSDNPAYWWVTDDELIRNEDGQLYFYAPEDSTWKQTISFVLRAKPYITGTNIDNIKNYSTLLPYQKYKFYIHFVKENGEITNGYYCGGDNAGEIECTYQTDCNVVNYPIFSNIIIPDNYSACFFSIVHIENTIATLINVHKYNEDGSYIANCVDIGSFLFKNYNNVIAQYNNIELKDNKYYFSSDNEVSLYFGANGIFEFNISHTDVPTVEKVYAIIKHRISESENIELIKCTPFISKINSETEIDVDTDKFIGYKFSDFTNMNLLGFICKVYPLDTDKTIEYYTEGTTGKIKDVESSDLKLNNIRTDDDISKFKLSNSDGYFVYSNYNLNYLELTEEYTTNYFNSKSEDNYTSTIVRLFSSLTLSALYTLPSMYKNYTRKTYSIYKPKEIIRFDNTIRSSLLEEDEGSIDVIKFHPNDYYNVSTNKGKITNLVSVGDSILVHTEDSLFRFSGSNTIQSSDGEILPSEGEPFDTGISEVFGSDFGFAGLQNKQHSIICELGYIYFDADSRIIYMYSGQGQITKLSDSIEKLFRHRPIKSINFANDYYNNRIFVNVKFIENDIEYPATLSFSILENVKNFVSLHDFTFDKSFNTKTKCYFLNKNNNDICVVNPNYNGYYSDLELENDKLYPYSKTNKLFDSIIDVIINDNFESIKTLNAVNWCSNNVESEFKDYDVEDLSSLKLAEDFVTTKMSENILVGNPCKALQVYTDTCITPLNKFEKISNNEKITSLDSYKYPRYNQGFWTFNYFRNIQNAINNTKRAYDSDQNSLIEGKYFVVRFIFNEPFKLETLTLNYDIKR